MTKNISPDFDTSLLRTFVILAETGNFTRTAEHIHRTQSAVSMQIARLENQLDCVLFERDKRNVKLTEAGEKLLGLAGQIVKLSSHLADQFNEEDVEGIINFGSPEDFATFYLPEILSDFVGSHPGIQLNVNCELTLNLIKQFEKNAYDLIIIKQEPGKLHIGARPLWREHLVWVSGDEQDMSLSFKKVIKKYQSKNRGLPLILSPAPCVYRQRAIEAMERAEVNWQIRYTSPSLAGVTAAVKAGLGLTVLPLQQSSGWPRLKDAEICLLTKEPSSGAVESLVQYIRKRVSHNLINARYTS